ncbi:acetylxylan esterase [Verrucomicrobia bacterium]|nr:acetylxylan esterase [Verrucomicrobiota bacterium]
MKLPLIFLATCVVAHAADSLSPLKEVPQNVTELWAGYDPQKEPLRTEVVREWEEDGVVVRYLRYYIGTFKGKPAWMAAFYAFPKSAKNLPGVLHMHGGGQRANLTLVKFHASQGYGALSVNWGGKPMEGARPGEANTDWGAVDPTQNNVQGYFNLLPGVKFLDAQESPRNCNWFLITLGCRRGLTFLEQQSEVNGKRLGIRGHSMGGNLTMYVAGSDSRVKVASPSVGGSGYRTYARYGLLPQIRKVTGDLELFRRTMGYQFYAPRITAPLLHLGASNDFHGQMDATYATGARVSKKVPQRFVFAPHFNHRFYPEQQVSRILWLDQHLKGGVKLPETTVSELKLKSIPILRVTPSKELPVNRVDIYYSVDPDSRSRFWRDTKATQDEGSWEAQLPVMDLKRPLFAFANIYYQLPKPAALPRNQQVEEVCISSLFHEAKPEALEEAGVKTSGRTERVIDDFKRGFHDWYALGGNQRPLWQYWTRKVTDPKWRGPKGAKLALTIQSEQPNVLGMVLHENTWRRYRGKNRTYVAEVKLKGGTAETVTLGLGDFKNVTDGVPLKNWEQLDELGLVANTTIRGAKPIEVAADPWQGPQPVFKRLEWQLKD